MRSFVELVAADELQQCLKRAHNPLDAVALLLRGESFTFSSTEYVQTLTNHGFKRAFFDCIDDHTPPVWLERYVAELISFSSSNGGNCPMPYCGITVEIRRARTGPRLSSALGVGAALHP